MQNYQELFCDQTKRKIYDKYNEKGIKQRTISGGVDLDPFDFLGGLSPFVGRSRKNVKRKYILKLV